MDELDALKQLTSSDGWALFTRYASSQWSDSFVLDRIEASVAGIPSGDEPSNHETARNLLASRKAVLQMLAWPEQQMALLSKNHTPKGEQTAVQRFLSAVGR